MMPLGGELEKAFAIYDHLRQGPKAEYYYKWSLLSFIVCLTIHHIISPWIFSRYNASYRNLPRGQRMEWDSRAVSSIHATIVSVLCVTTLVTNYDLWNHPITCVSHPGLIALSISIGYFLCDAVSMPFYWWNRQLIIFLSHHLAASFAFYHVIQYRTCVFFGVYRLTTELSTPFVNQRWFYRTIGYKPDRRRVACVTLIFAVFFILTRNLMILPFWYISFISYKSEAYKICIQSFPLMTTIFVTTCGLLDCLNIHWAFRTCRIGSKAIKTLSTVDWQSDIRKAQARIHKRLRNLHRRVVTKDARGNNVTSLTDNHFSETSLMNSVTMCSSSGMSSSSYSTDSEHESVCSDVGEFPVPAVNDDQEKEQQEAEEQDVVITTTNENASSNCTQDGDNNNNDTELIHRVDKQEID
ncbi:unnamed protein product [Trichobilharzia szidati]|nr:unnamed protein product [Trichobilharzia szidati]